jgi:hypothetical protein
MPIPNPEPGLVISYAYLWQHERQAGREEGQKDRPRVMTPTDTSVVGPMARHAEDLAVAASLPDLTSFNGRLGGSNCRRHAGAGSASFASRCGHRLRDAGSTRAYPTSLTKPSMPWSALERWSTIRRDLEYTTKNITAY